MYVYVSVNICEKTKLRKSACILFCMLSCLMTVESKHFKMSFLNSVRCTSKLVLIRLKALAS